MKMNVTFSVDSSLLKNFISALESQNLNPDEVIEDYLEKFTGGPDPGPRPVPLIEKLLGKLENQTVGGIVSKVVIPLIQKGVASEEEIERMNEAAGRVSRKKFNAKPGNYCSISFNSPYALLIDRQTKEFCDDETPAKYSANYFEINGRDYHHCIQWQAGSRIPVNNWIRKHLQNWFENADEEQITDMKNFIEWGI